MVLYDIVWNCMVFCYIHTISYHILPFYIALHYINITLHCTTLHFSIVIKAKEQFQVYTRHRPQWWVGTWCKMPTPLYTVYCKPNDICKQGASKCQKIIIPWHQVPHFLIFVLSMTDHRFKKPRWCLRVYIVT